MAVNTRFDANEKTAEHVAILWPCNGMNVNIN